jgi:serine/threonine-protein kinase
MESQSAVERALAGRYDVVREIGRGGMAVVYLANDVRHQRPVAVKLLNPDLAALIGPERFLSEIRITARLQHPNLLPLFDSGEVNGIPYYVMPYVEGESLRARLDREKQLPVNEAVRLAGKMASALDHAHRQNVIHRDLKPENILLHDGEPLIADFGIALAVTNAGGSRLTQTGLSVGTPQYMSPEQAAADRAIDGRTDIYALGAVVYEMLTGEPPLTGPTAQAVLAKIAVVPPRSTRESRSTIPPLVDDAVLRALAKIPADRWPTAHEFADALAAGVSRPTEAHAVSSQRARRSRFAMPAAILTALAVGAATTYAMMRDREAAPAPSYAFVLPLPESAAVSLGMGASGNDIAISRDGRSVAYVAGPTSGGDITRGIWMRQLDELTPRPLRPDGGTPRFSPDGTRLLYSAASGLLVAPLGGGPPVRVAGATSSYDWIDARSIVFTRGSAFWANRAMLPLELWAVTIGDTTARRLAGPDSSRRILGVAFPNVLPGGQRALATIWKGDRGDAEPQLAVVSLSDGKLTELGIAGSNPRFSLGHILFVKQDGGLYAVPFDAKGGHVTGEAWQVVPQVLVKLSGWADFDVSDNGTLVYLAGSDFHRRLVLVDRTGAARPLFPELRRYFTPRVSPDGRRIAVEVGLMTGFDIWSYDTGSRTFGAITHDGRSARPGGWTSDGSQVAFLKIHPGNGTWTGVVAPANGGGSERIAVAGQSGLSDLSPAGATMAVASRDGIQIMATADSARRRLVVPSSRRPGVMRLSNDGRIVAYESKASEPTEIYASSVSDGSEIQISSGGGSEPLWSRAGDQVFYRGGPYLISASIARSPLRVVRRDTLFRDEFVRGAISTNYDVMPNGQFVMVQNQNPDVNPTVIVDWLRHRRP